MRLVFHVPYMCTGRKWVLLADALTCESGDEILASKMKQSCAIHHVLPISQSWTGIWQISTNVIGTKVLNHPFLRIHIYVCKVIAESRSRLACLFYRKGWKLGWKGGGCMTCSQLVITHESFWDSVTISQFPKNHPQIRDSKPKYPSQKYQW
jgi:hypothetical protein